MAIIARGSRQGTEAKMMATSAALATAAALAALVPTSITARLTTHNRECTRVLSMAELQVSLKMRRYYGQCMGRGDTVNSIRGLVHNLHSRGIQRVEGRDSLCTREIC